VGYCSSSPANLNESQKLFIAVTGKGFMQPKIVCGDRFMSFFKFTSAEALSGWDRLQADANVLREAGETFASLFGGRAVFTSDGVRESFAGVKFSGAMYLSPEIWTKPTSRTGFACWPKSKAPAGKAEEHKALSDAWNAQRPKMYVDKAVFYPLLGLDWGTLLFTGITYFRHGDAIYVETSATPKAAAGAVEILGSEFEQAKRECMNAKA